MKKYLIYVYAVLVTAALGYLAYNAANLVDIVNEMEAEQLQAVATTTDPYEEALKEIGEREDFKVWTNLEQRTIYWTEQKERADFELRQIEAEKLENQQARAEKLRNYFAERNPSLVPYADEVAGLDRWLDVVAIAYAETHLCTRGVGASRTNCGAIKNAKTGEFKKYANEYDALWDINYLLHEPHMLGKTIEEMNGTYCVHEESESGLGKCPGWTERIEAEKLVVLNS